MSLRWEGYRQTCLELPPRRRHRPKDKEDRTRKHHGQTYFVGRGSGVRPKVRTTFDRYEASLLEHYKQWKIASGHDQPLRNPGRIKVPRRDGSRIPTR